MKALKRGTILLGRNNNDECRIEKFIGGGSQGDVFSAQYKNSSVAVKWYKKDTATQVQYDRVRRLISIGPPSPRFLWPIDIVTSKNNNRFGYIMPLLEKRFITIPKLLNGAHSDKLTLHSLTTAGFQIADSFLKLHSQGNSYGDISLGNLFMDAKTGEVKITDNDNVTVDGDPDFVVFGTPTFMAPEIVRGEAAPTTQTDLFSLAVLLFYLLYRHHPLDGKRRFSCLCINEDSMRVLYGTNPLYIFDPNDDSNMPLPGQQDNPLIYQEMYPSFIRDLFERSFTKGLNDPDRGRVRESEWRSSMIKLRDLIVPCSTCGMENFFTVDTGKTCWKCSHNIEPPARVNIGGSVVTLPPGRILYPHHLFSSSRYDFTNPVGQVVKHPQHKNVTGIKNRSSSKWVIERNKDLEDIMPGETFRIRSDVIVHFGERDGIFKESGQV
jgi:eukaryotic-like serine/threonine-protein kinase